MVILCIAVLGTLLVVAQPARARRLAGDVRPTTVVLALLGAVAQVWGMQIGVPQWSHALIIGSMLALLAATWSLRRWPGGWLIVGGVALNALAMSVYGRMPITPDVLAQFDLAYTVGHVLDGSKDIVAQGAIATWFGDRFVLGLPWALGSVVWSLGDVVLLGGLCRAAVAKVPA
jgi:hypothetical protein